jgi:hypothetical protein
MQIYSTAPASAMKWDKFQSLGLPDRVSLQGVYGIVQIRSDRVYVGSSVDIHRRLAEHISALDKGMHHSAKLQRAYREDGFKFVLIEIVPEINDLRRREQHWINELRAFSHGFNSKSIADGPEPSLETHIVNAERVHLPIIQARLKPRPSDFVPTPEDRKGFTTDLRQSLLKKAKQAGIGAVIAWGALDLPGFRFLWIPLILFALIIASDWPDSPQTRAHRRYLEAEADAERRAREELIRFIADRLAIPEQHVAGIYPSAHEIVQRRDRLREKYRYLNRRR